MRIFNSAAEKAAEHNKHGNEFVNAGDWEKAIAEYSEAIKLDSNNAQYYHNRGYCYTKLNSWDKAIADFKEAIRLDPNDADSAFVLALSQGNLGAEFRKNGKWEEAITCYSEAIRLKHPSCGKCFNNRGLCYFNLKNLDKAIADFTEAVRLDPDNAAHKENLAAAQAEAGK